MFANDEAGLLGYQGLSLSALDMRVKSSLGREVQGTSDRLRNGGGL